MIQLLDYPCEATGWSAPIAKETWEAKNTNTREDATASDQSVKPSGLKADAVAFTKRLTAGLETLISVEPEVTRFDTVVGDGDCGIGLKRGAEGMIPLVFNEKGRTLTEAAVLKHLKETPATGDLVVDVANIVPVIENSMDGTVSSLKPRKRGYI